MIRHALAGQPERKQALENFQAIQTHSFSWNDEIRSVHIFLTNPQKEPVQIKLTRLPEGSSQFLELNEGLERIILSKSNADEQELLLEAACQTPLHILPVLDRAHFPVVDETKTTSYA